MHELKDKNIDEAVMYMNKTLAKAREIELARKGKPRFQEMCNIIDSFAMSKITRRAFGIVGEILKEDRTPPMFIEKLEIDGELIVATYLTLNAFKQEHRQYLVDNYAAYMEQQGWIFRVAKEQTEYTTEH